MLSTRYEKIKALWLEKLQRELPSYLLYHSPDHTQNVINACSYLAVKEGVNDKDKEILLLAALFHDSGYLTRYANNEEVGVQLSQAVLPHYGISTKATDQIAALILATKPNVQPVGILEEIIQDADLNYLGRPDYDARSQNLRSELHVTGQVYTDVEWLQIQYEFLSNFEYRTASAIRLVGSGLKKNRRIIEQMLTAIKK
jgi:predicted metal-dependent HD superfamily phosphohydrolase